ncbi:hypothetical protein SeMB42_g01324 [Synchytrium endobioticum]|uniref:Uncharacterized protein n=1 Tax=Synchytrium endobioticum TaxID=286115 RepID=A0A507DD06_9FUNG|nr:hypothetical protein SeLEV6574_g01605 [Synchytrium endobioticum]TPX52580.1 hypothetical protein SeMB42_g01324 [Synchytrium endobioticum]
MDSQLQQQYDRFLVELAMTNGHMLDYLSELVWEPLDILETRKYLLRTWLPAIMGEWLPPTTYEKIDHENQLAKAQRYTNALWRRWHMSQHRSPRIAPTLIGWLKDADSQFLYGAFHQHPYNLPSHLKSIHSGSAIALHRHLNQSSRSASSDAQNPTSPPTSADSGSIAKVIRTRKKSELLLTSPPMTAYPPPKGILKRPSQLNLLEALLTPLPPSTLEKLDALSADASLSTDPKELILSQNIESAASPSPSNNALNNTLSTDGVKSSYPNNSARAALFSTSRPSPYKRHSSDSFLCGLYEGRNLIPHETVAIIQRHNSQLLHNKQKAPHSSSSTVSFASMLEKTVIIKDDDEDHDDEDDDDVSSYGSLLMDAHEVVDTQTVALRNADAHIKNAAAEDDEETVLDESEWDKLTGQYSLIQHTETAEHGTSNALLDPNPEIVADDYGDNEAQTIIQMATAAFHNGVEMIDTVREGLSDAFVVAKNVVVFGGLLF